MMRIKNQAIKILLLFQVVFIVAGCSKPGEASSSDCNGLSTAIDTKTDAYNSNNSTANCQAVIAAYNDYINSTCLDAAEKSSYENERDAFKAAHCP